MQLYSLFSIGFCRSKNPKSRTNFSLRHDGNMVARLVRYIQTCHSYKSFDLMSNLPFISCTAGSVPLWICARIVRGLIPVASAASLTVIFSPLSLDHSRVYHRKWTNDRFSLVYQGFRHLTTWSNETRSLDHFIRSLDHLVKWKKRSNINGLRGHLSIFVFLTESVNLTGHLTTVFLYHLEAP